MTFLYVKLFLAFIILVHLLVYIFRKKLTLIWTRSVQVTFWLALVISLVTLFSNTPYQIIVENSFENSEVKTFFVDMDHWIYQQKKLPARVKMGIENYIADWAESSNNNLTDAYWSLIAGTPPELPEVDFELPEATQPDAETVGTLEKKVYPRVVATSVFTLRWIVLILCLLLMTISLQAYFALAADLDNRAQQDRIQELEEKIRKLETREIYG